MKIVNTSNAPYEFTWDGGNYPAILPGEIADYPDAIAEHAIKRSVILDEEGEGIPMGYRIERLSEVSPSEQAKLKVRCPYVATGTCNAQPMTKSDLRAHLEAHWHSELPAATQDLDLVPAGTGGAMARPVVRK